LQELNKNIIALFGQSSGLLLLKLVLYKLPLYFKAVVN